MCCSSITWFGNGFAGEVELADEACDEELWTMLFSRPWIWRRLLRRFMVSWVFGLCGAWPVDDDGLAGSALATDGPINGEKSGRLWRWSMMVRRRKRKEEVGTQEFRQTL